MTKSEILALMEACIKELEALLSNVENKVLCESFIFGVRRDMEVLKGYEENPIVLKEYEEKYRDLYYRITGKNYEVPVTAIAVVEPEKTKVVRVIPEEEQEEEIIEERNNSRKILKGIGIVTLILLILMAIGLIVDKFNDKTNNDLPTKDPVNDTTIEMPVETIGIEDINLDDNSALMTYAMDIQSKLTDSELTVNDIMYAIKLANFDRLTDKDVFKDRDGVCYSSLAGGEIIKQLGSDSIVVKDQEDNIYLSEDQLIDVIMCVTDNNLNIKDFESCKTAEGYDLYLICELCAKKMDTDTKCVDYAKVFNDVVTRYFLNFTICDSSPLGTRYMIAGLYNECSPKILELTSGNFLGPIYGNTARIDGTYGHICVEELEAFMKINNSKGEAVGNEDNIFYTLIIDEQITTHSSELGK